MYVISGYHFNEFKIKGSLFKAYTFDINNIGNIKKRITQLENKFPDASHICYAYRICNIDNLDLFYNPEIIEFSTDAGEPSGTAGKPILNILKKNKIVNRIIFVVRYFGGTKLGIPGLIKSYKYASELVIKNIECKEWILLKSLILKLSYEYHKIVNKVISDYNGKVIKSNFSDMISLNIEIPYKNLIEFKKIIIEKSNGTIALIE